MEDKILTLLLSKDPELERLGVMAAIEVHGMNGLCRYLGEIGYLIANFRFDEHNSYIISRVYVYGDQCLSRLMYSTWHLGNTFQVAHLVHKDHTIIIKPFTLDL